jgi:AraC-like DNA-binding protein
MSVSVTLVRTLVEELVRAGTDPDAFLTAANVDPKLLDDPNARIDIAAYDRLHESALDTIGDAALGLHMAERATLSAFHVVGFLSVHCRTIRQAIGVFVQYRSLLSECPAPELHEEGDRAYLTCFFIRGPERCNRLRAEFNVTGLVKVAQLSLGMARPPLLIEFEHAAPWYAEEYSRVFGCPIRFGSEATRIHVERSVIDAALIHGNDELFSLLKAQADRHLDDLTRPRSLSRRIRSLMLEHYDGTKPSMESVARRLGVSSRSLRRRLSEEGMTYAEVVDEAMADVARRMLYDRARSIQDIADRLGFSEPSAFHRAFKRWTGLTPGQFRIQCTGSAEP